MKAVVPGMLLVLVLVYGGWLVWKWGFTRVYVGPDEALIVIGKYGEALPSDMVVIPKDKYDRYKGVQEEVRGPGRYFINPVMYDTRRVTLLKIPAGDPERWNWTPEGKLTEPRSAPRLGLITSKQGKTPPVGQVVVDPGFKGIQREVLTPGTYKINPYLHEVELVPAALVPPGSVGVMTRLFGDRGEVIGVTLSEIRAGTSGTTTQEPAEAPARQVPSRLVVGETQRGILRDVLQPGIYYLNPRLYQVSIMPVGYDAITLEHPKNQIRFYSFDGYLVEADVTVVWGRSPADAPNIVANIGDIDRVRENVLEPAMKAASQNEGAKYTAKELIQGSTRSKFQDDLSASLEKQVASRNIHVLLALIRNISIKDKSGRETGLVATIQRANIEIENQLTNKQKTETEKKKGELEQASKLVDVEREKVAAETKVKVANILAEGRKRAAEIDAKRELDVATIELQVAELDAQREQILGKAAADVSRLKNEAEARGAELLVEAFGSPQSFNLYTFARYFQPTDMRLFFAGPGTFWTDLKSFEQIGASKILEQAQEKKP
jgi:regulator of protease activity HflC (stomatin/prohibitin superfamily)